MQTGSRVYSRDETDRRAVAAPEDETWGPLSRLYGESIGRRYLRSAVRVDIAVPRTDTKTLRQRNFAVYAYYGPFLWNRLPTSIRSIELSL